MKDKAQLSGILTGILLAIILLMGCEDGKKDMLEGRWKMIWMKNQDFQIDARDLGSPILQLDKKDQHYKVTVNETLEEGTWNYSKGVLLLTPKDKQANSFMIDSMDKNTLIYHTSSEGNQVKVFYVRVPNDEEEEE